MNSRLVRWPLQVILVAFALYIALLYYFDTYLEIENFAVGIPIVVRSVWLFVITKALWVAAFCIVGYGFGRLVLDITRVSSVFENTEEDILFSIATGWGLIGLGALGLGSLGLLDRWLHLGLGVFLTGISYRQLVNLATAIRKNTVFSNLSHTELLLTVTIVTMALWAVVLSFLPEYGFDALNSHLPAPLHYLKEGRISFHPEINFNNFPQTVEMWFMESLMWIPEGACSHLMMICHLMVALTVYITGRRFFGRGAGLSAMLIYLMLKQPLMLATVGFIDQGLSFMLVLGMYGFLCYLEKQDLNRAILVGVVLGIACGIKYSAFITVAILAFSGFVYLYATRGNLKKFMLHMGIAALVLLLICSAWYIRNVIWFNNPFFPFFGNVFKSNGGTYANLVHELAADHKKMLEMFAVKSRNPVYFFLLPISLVYSGFGPYDMNGGALGVLPLLTIPLTVFIKNYPKIFWAILGLVVITFAYWFFIEGMIMLRYMVPIFSMIAVVSGFLVWNGLPIQKLRATGIGGWVTMALIFTILLSYFNSIVTPPLVRGQMPILPSDRDEFIRMHHPGYPALKDLNARFREEGIIDDVRVYGYAAEQHRWHAEFTLVGSKVGYANYEQYEASTRSAEELYNWLRHYDIDYLIINLPYAVLIEDKFPEGVKPPASLQEWMAYIRIPQVLPGWQEYFEEVSNQYYVFVYRLK